MQRSFLATWLVCLLILAEGPVTVSGQESSDDPPKHTNQLAGETSPYLLSHAHNPVNWYPWGPEALALAKEQNKPIFLSVGYSSCHWCHVMERESFMDEEIAKILNENFICIKVDREERPDVDAIYMESLNIFQQLRRSKRGGGWPLSMFLTSDARPFFGGTYFPARDGDRGASMGFLTILQTLKKQWDSEKVAINRNAELITEYTKKSLAGLQPTKDASIKPGWIDIGLLQLKERFDPEFGGFRYEPENDQIPKFPEPSTLLFLIDRLKQDQGNSEARDMLVKTCEQMMLGGIQDHLGGGFHRYSVDRYWKIPHFEKMLYDNGQLATVYAELYGLTGQAAFRRTVEDLLDFVLREMTHEQGGFYSALDADSEGEEGKFYRWDKQEVESLLDAEEFKLFAEVYGLDGEPNFEEKWYAPQLKQRLAETAQKLSISEDELLSQLAPIRQKLLEHRAKRVRPNTDNKILTSWNGMMIRGFADAGRVLEKPEYVDAARRAAEFVLNTMVDEQGRLKRTFTDGQVKLNAYVEDYACLIRGLLGLHEATGEKAWLERAELLQQKQDELFWDSDGLGYFYTSDDHESLIARAKRFVDSAIPAGNSVAAQNLMYLADQLDNDEYRERARQCVIAASGLIERVAIVAPRLLMVVDQLDDD